MTENVESIMTSMILPLVLALLASSGFWGFVQGREVRKRSDHALLLGLAHTEIVRVGESYILRGYITSDEYEDFVKYLYLPYSSLGGNGLAERIFKEVTNLPFSVDKNNNNNKE